MSFASEVKKELARVETEKSCCQLAEIAGFMRVAADATLGRGGHFGLQVSTREPSIARHYKKLVKEYFSIDAELRITETDRFGKAKKYMLSVGGESGGEQILRETGMLMIKKGKNYLTDGIMDSLVKSKCCRRSYLRGIFLGAGTVSDPRKAYHWEVKCDSKELAQDLSKLIHTFRDLACKISIRRGKYVVYMKRSAYVADMLAIMEAHTHFLDMQSTFIEKELKEEVVRITNCDNANLDRALDAAHEQIKTIEGLKKNGKFEQLSPKLKEIAELRISNPEASLTQLG